jgi:capsular exopolysaccharide synthesis family protein
MTTVSSTVQERIALPGSVRGVGGEGGGSPTAADLITMLRRRTLLIVVLFALFASLAVGGFAIWWVFAPGYRSEALIECISNIPRAELTPEQERLRQDEHERFVLTQARLLTSPTILGEALKVTAVRETKWWKSIKQRWSWSKKPGRHLIALTDDLHAAPMRGTNFLRVSMECRHAEDPRVIVTAVVNQWYESVRKRAAEEFVDTALEAAQQELEQLDRGISEDRERLKSITRRLPAGARQDPAGNITSQQVEQFSEQVALLHLELSQLEQYRDIYNDPEGAAVTAEDRAMVELDPRVAELSRTLSLLERQRAADAKVFGSEHSVLKQLDAQIEATDAKLTQVRTEKLRERRADIREAANTAYDNTRHALFLAQENLARAEAALQDQDHLLFDYFNLEGEIQQKVEYRLQLDNYVKSLTRVKTQRTAINVNIAQPAIDPLQRSSPSLLMLPAGVFFSLMLSVGIALGLELLDKSVRTSQDIVRYLDTAMLGAVPHTDDEEVPIERVETAVRDASQSMVAEAFRRIRTNLQFSAPAQRQRSVMVTSSHPDDGKTTVACNLAMAVAQGGRRVLLVDANFHRPGVNRLFDNAREEGLGNILTGKGSLAAYVVQTTTPLLDVLGGGPTPSNPAELLGGEKCRAFLEEAMSRYDQVILDTAPVLLASDALVLATAVDGVVLVVRANRNSRGVARRACTLLTDVGAHIFGAVLNAAQATRGGYFREQLRAHYDYQATAATSSETEGE